MKDKHLNIAADNELLRYLQQEVKRKLIPQTGWFRMVLWLKLAVYLSASAFCYYSLLKTPNVYLFLACYVGYGFATLLFAFNFAHDLSHYTVFKSRRQNLFFYTLIYTMVGAHAEAWQQRHVHSHHFAPNVKDYDSDLRITKMIRVIPGSERRWYHRYQHWYAPLAYTSYSLFWVFIKDVVILFSPDEFGEGKDWRYHLSFWLQKAAYLSLMLVLPLLFAHQVWWVVLLGFLLMHLSQSLFLLFTFFMTHHVESTHYPETDEQGIINTSWLMNQIRSSNDMHPFSETANFILGGFNNHIAHHLFPQIHHIYYPRLNRIIYPILKKRGIIPNQTTYWGGILSHLRLLKRMGR